MSLKSLLQRSQLFREKGLDYTVAYTRWRVTWLAQRWQIKLYPAAWPPLPALPSAGLHANTPPTEAGPTLASYLATREHRLFHFTSGEAAAIAQQVPEMLRDRTIATAQALLEGKHTYRGRTGVLDREPDWQTAIEGSADWRWDLNRHYWFSTLARAWHYTGDETFVQQAVRLLHDWMVHNPPDVRNPVWRPFEVATRLNNWVWGLFLLLKCPLFAREGAGYLWQGLVSQSHYLYRHLERHVVNNHLLIETKTLAMLGLLFPELPAASRWLHTGLEILWSQVRRQFHPDGVHTEQATQYHALCTGELWEMLTLLRRNAHPIPPDVLARFEAAVAFQTALVKPDGYLPLFGDSARHDLHHRFDACWASVWLGKDRPAASPPNEETQWLLGATPLPGRSETPPASRAFPQGGYVVMRDADTYLVLDSGPFGDERVASHAHADALSMEICAFGQTLLTDSGGYSYHATSVWRNYFRSTRAHNTVVVDNQDQSELIGTRLVYRPAQARLRQWFTTPLADWAVAEQDGYARLSPPVIHRRHILFVKPHYWLVLDSLLGDGEHRLDWHFHLPPGATWRTEPDRDVVCASMGKAGLALVTPRVDGLSLQVVEGQISPPQGWVSLESGEKLPAPDLVFTQQGFLPVHLPIVLIPSAVEQIPSLRLDVLPVENQLMTLTVGTSDACDEIVVALQDQATPIQKPPLEVEAQVLWVRHLKNQPPVALALGAQAIAVAGRDLWAGPGSSWVSLTEKDSEWRLTKTG